MGQKMKKLIIILLALHCAVSFALTYKQAVCKTLPAGGIIETDSQIESCKAILKGSKNG
jgi:hypothetical protein